MPDARDPSLAEITAQLRRVLERRADLQFVALWIAVHRAHESGLTTLYSTSTRPIRGGDVHSHFRDLGGALANLSKIGRPN